MNTPRSTTGQRPAPVEPGFADLPLSAPERDGALDSGVLAMLHGPSAHDRAEADEPLPPGRSTRAGEH